MPPKKSDKVENITWVLAILALVIAGVVGFCLSDGIPEVINLEESERTSLEQLNERSLFNCGNEYEREIDRIEINHTERIEEMAESNQNIIDTYTDDILPTIEDLTDMVQDFNRTLTDLNFCDCNR